MPLCHAPDHPLQPGNALACQTQCDDISRHDIALLPATQRSNIDPPDRLIIQLYRLQIKYSGYLPGSADWKIDGEHFSADFRRLIFPGNGPCSLSRQPVFARRTQALMNDDAVSDKGQRSMKPALPPRCNLLFVFNAVAPVCGNAQSPAAELLKAFRHLARPR